MPSRCCSSRSSMRMSARSLASRFESGSSNSSTDGENAKARASATRCCCPPESCEAPRSAKRAHLHQVERARDLLAAPPPRSCAARASRRRRSRTPSCAARSRRTGTPSTARASRPACSRRRRRRIDRRAADADLAARSAAPARRWPAASSSCRSRTGPSSVSCSPALHAEADRRRPPARRRSGFRRSSTSICEPGHAPLASVHGAARRATANSDHHGADHDSVWISAIAAVSSVLLAKNSSRRSRA